MCYQMRTIANQVESRQLLRYKYSKIEIGIT